MNKAAFQTKYNDATSGLYRAGQDPGSIGSNDHRSLVEDISDSALFSSDDLPKIFDLASGDAPLASNDYVLGLPYPITDYSQHRVFAIQFNQENTGPATLEYGDLGAWPIVKQVDGVFGNLEPNDIRTSCVYLIAFIGGSQFAIVGSIGGDNEVSGSISSASIKNSFTAPVTLKVAGGAGKAHVVESIIFSMDYNSVAYATNTSFEVLVGSTSLVGEIVGFLNSGADKVIMFSVQAQEVEINQPIVFKAVGGNPTAGNSVVKYRIKYKTVTI